MEIKKKIVVNMCYFYIIIPKIHGMTRERKQRYNFQAVN